MYRPKDPSKLEDLLTNRPFASPEEVMSLDHIEYFFGSQNRHLMN